jgi:SAM-dependent methyltransferase
MALYPLTIFLSAFLLFLVQPVIAKQILPWFGGSAGVWTTCLFFFQFLLLCGYAYAHWSIRVLRPKPQVVLHIVLLLASLASLPILAAVEWKPAGSEQPALRILLLLSATVGLPYFMLSTTGPLLQAWYARITDSPYRLFALSNFASLLGLLCYPFLLEPLITTQQQAWYWSAGQVVFVVLCALTALYSLRRARQAGAVTATPMTAERPPTRGRRFTWIALSAMGSFMLLAITNHMTQNIASMPLLWVLPLALYLLTFILCFEGRGWYKRPVFFGPVLTVLVAMMYVNSDLSLLLDLQVALPVFAAGLFAVCMFCHGELATLKPAPRYLTGFYLMIALGGAIGSLLVSVVAPLTLPGDFELQIGIVVCALLVVRQTRKEPLWFPAIAAFAVAGVTYGAVADGVERVRTYHVMARNFYGSLHTKNIGDPATPAARRQLTHGVIQHGEQWLAPDRAGEPISYYGPESGIGLAIASQTQPGRRVGVIGLGAGTIAAYGRPGDLVKFYDINPQVIAIANTEFTYLSGSKARVDVALGDARLVLEREAPQHFDILAVDAFSSDAIPVHLLTRQAFEVYLRHLNPAGILAIHVTNRYLNLAPVVKDIADALDLAAIHVQHDAEGVYSSTDWVLVARDAALFETEPLADNTTEIDSDPSRRIWTDDFNNLFRAIKGLPGSKAAIGAPCDQLEPEEQAACGKKPKDQE